MVQVFIQSHLNGLVNIGDFPDNTTIQSVKQSLQQKFSWETLVQHLIFKGTELSNDQTLSSLLANTSVSDKIILQCLMQMDANNKTYLTNNMIKALELWKKNKEQQEKQQLENAAKLLLERQKLEQEQRQRRVEQRQQRNQPQQIQMPQQIPKLDQIPVDETQLAILISLDFDARRAKKALLLNHMNADLALDWLASNQDRTDYNMDAELTTDEFRAILQQMQQNRQQQQQQGDDDEDEDEDMED